MLVEHVLGALDEAMMGCLPLDPAVEQILRPTWGSMRCIDGDDLEIDPREGEV